MPYAENASSPRFLSPTGEIIASVTCAECGYDLKGLHVDGKCPECARPVRASLPKGESLTPAQMRRVAAAIGMLLVSSVLLHLGMLFTFFLSVRLGEYVYVAIAALALIAAVRTWACFRMTRADTLTKPFPNITDHRPTLRVLSTLSMGFWALAAIFSVVVLTGASVRPVHVARLIPACIGIATLFSGLGGIVVLSVAEHIADRLRLGKLQTSLNQLATVCIAVTVVGILVFIGPAIAWIMYINALAQLRQELLRRSAA